MTLLILGLVLFIGAHAFPMFAARHKAAVERYGLGPIKGVVSVVSLIGFVMIIYGYGQARTAGMPLLYQPPFWMSHVVWLLMIPAMIVLVAAYIPSRIKLWTKHPMLLAVKIWATAHLLANGELQSVVLFSSFLAWAVIARISAKRRERAGYLKPFELGDTPAANDLIVVVIGATAYVAFLLWLHGALIGVPLMVP
ncbi:MAG: NnrU family protein [Pseudomonadota bacterium]